MEDSQIRTALSEVFREIFEAMKPGASGTWLVEKNQGVFDAIETLSAAQASVVLNGQFASIGAHVRHLNHYLFLFNANFRGDKPQSDWAGSWSVNQFSEEEWHELGSSVQKEFNEAYAWYQTGEPRNEEERIYGVANIAHAAYHLGAIRALILLV